MQAWRRAAVRRRVLTAACTLGLFALALPNPTASATATSATSTPPTPKDVPSGLVVSRCSLSHRSPSDPIVHPGMSGMSHSHDFFGNRTTNADSTLASMTGQPTSCKTAGDTAAYWVPTLYANNRAVNPTDSLAYFQSFGTDATAQMPIGLKIVAGNKDTVRWACFDHGMANAKFLRPQTCDRTQMLSVGIRFPECWNGTDLDSADHRSHMAYAVTGVCPATHPVKVPRLTFWVLYERPNRKATLTLASGAIDTAHADFFNTADPSTQQKLHDYCLDGHRICYKNMYLVLKKLGLDRNATTKL